MSRKAVGAALAQTDDLQDKEIVMGYARLGTVIVATALLLGAAGVSAPIQY